MLCIQAVVCLQEPVAAAVEVVVPCTSDLQGLDIMLRKYQGLVLKRKRRYFLLQVVLVPPNPKCYLTHNTMEYEKGETQLHPNIDR